MGIFDDLQPFSDQEFQEFCKYIYENVGINLTEKKRSLVNNRLRKRLIELNFKSYGQYFNYIKKSKDENELVLMINSITTNVSSFFRDNKQFVTLAEILKTEFKSKTNPLRIWSAGCSTGQEPYTISITLLKEHPNLRYEIHGSDLSTRVLQIASKGIYTHEQIEKDIQDPRDVERFFIKRADHYEIKPDVKRNIKFFQHNLMHNNFPKNFDIIFCRNVIIYFDKETKEKLFQKFFHSLGAHGFLFLGHSESLFNNPLFRYYRPSIYKKVPEGEQKLKSAFPKMNTL